MHVRLPPCPQAAGLQAAVSWHPARRPAPLQSLRRCSARSVASTGSRAVHHRRGVAPDGGAAAGGGQQAQQRPGGRGGPPARSVRGDAPHAAQAGLFQVRGWGGHDLTGPNRSRGALNCRFRTGEAAPRGTRRGPSRCSRWRCATCCASRASGGEGGARQRPSCGRGGGFWGKGGARGGDCWPAPPSSHSDRCRGRDCSAGTPAPHIRPLSDSGRAQGLSFISWSAGQDELAQSLQVSRLLRWRVWGPFTRAPHQTSQTQIQTPEPLLLITARPAGRTSW